MVMFRMTNLTDEAISYMIKALYDKRVKFLNLQGNTL